MSLTAEFEKLRRLRETGAISQEEFDASKNRLLDQCVRRIEAFYDGSGAPPLPRWGLPPVKVVRGVIRSIRFSTGAGKEKYAAFINVDGESVEIKSASPIAMDLSDRVMFGGYEYGGRLLALAYHNESNGAYSDLNRLRKGCWLLLGIGALTILLALCLAAFVLIAPILQTPLPAFHSDPWRYMQYVLSAVATAAAGYFGMSLWVLGSRAKEFHDAMTSSNAIASSGYLRLSLT